MLKPLMRSALVLCVGVLFPSACTQTSSNNSTSSSGGGNGGGFDAGVTTNTCARDQDCGAGLVCGPAGTCIAGASCVTTANCGECEPGGSLNCGFTGAAYCDSAAGTCRRPNSSCGPCTSDEQCGSNEQLGLTNKCIAYGNTGSFCGLACNGACSPGFECKLGDAACPANSTECACKLATAIGPTCAGAPACTRDADCPDGTHCTTDLSNPPRQGVCLAFCLFDEECPQGTLCRSEPGPAYGTCTPACTPGTTGANNTICHAWGRFGNRCPTTACPTGFECTNSGYCDAAGCQSDVECLVARTICDTATQTCVEGCRTAEDCGAFEVCNNGQCAEQGCRGKNLSCNTGQFCCGKELYDTANGGQACPAPAMVGDCFNAGDPFCRRCEEDADCAGAEGFGQASHCYELQRGDADGGSQTLGKFCSVGCRNNDDCPRGVQCRELPGPNDTMVMGCLDAVCAALNPEP